MRQHLRGTNVGAVVVLEEDVSGSSLRARLDIIVEEEVSHRRLQDVSCKEPPGL